MPSTSWCHSSLWMCLGISNFSLGFLWPGKDQNDMNWLNYLNGFGTWTKFVILRIFAASLGTVAACLSSLSAVTIEDLLIAGLNMKITPQKGAFYAKWMSVGWVEEIIWVNIINHVWVHDRKKKWKFFSYGFLPFHVHSYGILSFGLIFLVVSFFLSRLPLFFSSLYHVSLDRKEEASYKPHWRSMA